MIVDIENLSQALERQAGITLSDGPVESVGGGSINRAYRVPSAAGPVFVKINASSALSMLEAEAAGLVALQGANAVRVPAVLATGLAGDVAYLALEWIGLGAKHPTAERELGRRLAQQHRVTSTSFGWDRDNTIGSTPQVNVPSEHWLGFFREQRLRYQLDLAARHGLPAPVVAQATTALARLDEILGDHRPRPSLLHGDLWGGNWGADAAGMPVIFDPAVYYGDRETDLAMTYLFGGFGRAFYAAYAAEWPLPAGAERRVDVYNLYHLLNHFNLFGAGYLQAVRAAIDKLGRAVEVRR